MLPQTVTCTGSKFSPITLMRNSTHAATPKLCQFAAITRGVFYMIYFQTLCFDMLSQGFNSSYNKLDSFHLFLHLEDLTECVPSVRGSGCIQRTSDFASSIPHPVSRQFVRDASVTFPFRCMLSPFHLRFLF